VLSGRSRRWRAGVATGLLLAGCAGSLPVRTAPLQGQGAEQLERDRAECEQKATRSTDSSPIRDALLGRLGLAIAGAVVGAVGGLYLAAAGNESDPERAALIIAGGAAVGAVLGYVVGTVAGASHLAREVRFRQERRLERYADCMRERGYRVEPERR
jgi:MFS family permease